MKQIIANMMSKKEQLCDNKELKEEYCEKCHTRKSVVLEVFGELKKIPCLCKCQSEKLKQLEQLEENRQKQYRLNKLKINSLMDKKFEQCTFQNWQLDSTNQKMYELGINYTGQWPKMKDENIGFILYGGVGIGKTYLVSCIANKLLEQYVPVIITSSIALLGRYKRAYSDKQAEVVITNNLQQADLLIIDDLGVENDTTWAKEKLYEIIDCRYRDAKPTIVTTNLTLKQLQDKLTGDDGVPRTYDRLIEMCYPIYLQGKSRRINAYNDKEKIIKNLLLD